MEDTFLTEEAHLQDRGEEVVIDLFMARLARKFGISRQTLRKGLKIKQVAQTDPEIAVEQVYRQVQEMEVQKNNNARHRRLVQQLRDCGLIE